jgi:type I restriction enzyme S subunit
MREYAARRGWTIALQVREVGSGAARREAREGERFGLAARVPVGLPPCLGQRVMLLQPSSKTATSEYLWALLNSSGLYQQALQLVGGSTSPHVNVGDIKAFKAFVPPVELQRNFSKIVLNYFPEG